MHCSLRLANLLGAGIGVLLVFVAQRANAQTESTTQSSSPQSAAQSSTSSTPKTLRTTTRLVQISVVVNNKSGEPIPGLRKDDFTLFVDGKPQFIQLFSTENNLVPLAPDSADARALPPDTYTNRVERRNSNVTVILLDELNTNFADKVFARNQVREFLKQIQPRDRLALYWLGNRLRVLHDFGGDASTLRAALASLRGEESRQLANSEVEDPSLNNPNSSIPAGTSSDRQAFREAFAQRAANDATVDRVGLTIRALISIANHIGPLPGRKNLVWISGTFPFNLGYERFDLNWVNDTGVGFGADVERAARSLTNANIAVYPVDARGLIGDVMSATRENEFGIAAQQHEPAVGPPRGEINTMKILAARTGGRAFYSTNNIASAIRRAMDDSRLTYTLGYYPGDMKWDGSFHTIKVSVNVPGASVRSRAGYFALPDPPRTSQASGASISQAVLSQLDAKAIGIQVDVKLSHGAHQNVITATVHLDLRDIQMEEKAGHWTGKVQSVFFLLNDGGQVIANNDRTFRLVFDPPTYERILKNGLSDTRELSLLPAATQLCIVTRDASNGNLGSVLIPLAKYFPAREKSK